MTSRIHSEKMIFLTLYTKALYVLIINFLLSYLLFVYIKVSTFELKFSNRNFKMIWIFFLNIIKAEEKCPICEFMGIAKSENFAITGQFFELTS